MAVIYYKEKFGEMTIRQGENKFKIEIRDGNCLAVFVYLIGKTVYLYSFFNDEKHANAILKDWEEITNDKIVSVRLNTYYKESYKLLRIFTKKGYKVNCYYNENNK